MTPTATESEKELARRAGDGFDVSLYWDERTDRITLRIYDARSEESFELEVDRRHALDAFRHPFAYTTAKQAA
jgi:hypothetical protein